MKILKNTDLTISKIALGTDSYGSIIDKKLSFEMLDFYKGRGGNVIDTAECYANWVEGGEHASENTIGDWMRERNNRHDMIISTKGGHYKPGENPRLSEADIFTDLEGSLKRLGTDYIDIYWLHRDAVSIPVCDIMDTLEKAVKQGKVRYIGASNWTCHRICEANGYAEKEGFPRFVASQIQYSAAKPNMEKNEPDLVLMNKEEYEYFKNHDMTVFAFASQAKGFFSKYDNGGIDALSKKAYERYFNENTILAYNAMKKISKEHGCSIGSAALAALLNNNDFDTVPIIGCKNISQLSDSLCGADLILTNEEMSFMKGNNL